MTIYEQENIASFIKSDKKESGLLVTLMIMEFRGCVEFLKRSSAE